MKRGLRIVTGITALIAMMFFYGFVDEEKVWADSGKATVHPQTMLTMPLSKENELLQDHSDIDVKYIEEDVSAKTASSSITISKNTTIGSKTYNSNVLINYGATLTISANSNVIINGDLKIWGRLVISSGKLTVNGSLYVLNQEFYGSYNLGSLVVSGTAAVTVNKAVASGGMFLDGGILSMLSGNPCVTVNGTFIAESYAPAYSNGSLIVNGNFIQSSYFCTESFAAGDNFKVIIKGPRTTPRKIIFTHFNDSYFSNIDMSGATISSDSIISYKPNLSMNSSVVCPYATVYVHGDLKGKTLTISAKLTITTPQNGEALYLHGGRLVCNGDLAIGNYSRILMQDSNAYIRVNGNFIAAGLSDYMDLGTLEINGDFYQYNYVNESYAPKAAFITKITGQNRYVYFETPVSSHFTRFELSSGSTLDPDSVVSIFQSLEEDLTFNVQALYFRGDLQGQTLMTKDLYVPSAMTINGGTLLVMGDMTLSGTLNMSNPGDLVVISNDFITNNNANTLLTDGKLFIAGDFAQSGNIQSFRATANHTTILNGSGIQTVSFASTNPAAGSKFAHLVVVNDSIDTGALPPYYDDLTVSGTWMKGIATDTGTLSPTFDTDDYVYDYVVLLPTGTNSVTITPELLDRYAGTAWLTEGDGTDPITSVTVSDVSYDGSKTVTVKAHAWSDVESATYTFRVMQINPDLASLGTLPEGSVLEPAFDPAVHDYTVQLPETVASFLWAPVADHPDSTVHIDATDGPASVTVALTPGQSAAYSVNVIAQDGVTANTYSVTFTRRNPLMGITVSSGTLTPAFSAGTANYTVYVPSSVPSVTIAALKDDTDPDWSKFTINDVEQSEITLSPDPGASAMATIKAWDADNKTVTTYTVTVNRIAMLAGITTSAGALTPAFDAATGHYSVYVSGSVTSVRITPTKTASCTAMRINGSNVSYITLSPAAGGKSTATIDCTNGTGAQAVTQRYIVDVYRIAPITGITITGGKLAPTFSTATTVYTVSVPATTSAVTVKPVMTASYKAGTLTINGSAVSYVTLRPAVGGSLQAKIRAQAVNGVWYAYTVTVKRTALLTGVRVSPGTLSPAFKPTVLAYSVVRVPATATQVKITPVKASTGVKSMTINGRAASYAYIKPPVGGSANCTIVATASDGRTKVTYTIKVTRDPLISAIRTSVGALTPAFSPTRTAYTINVPATASSVTITPVKTAYTKTLMIDNRVQSYKRVSPPLGGSVTCTIVATATDGRTKSTYTVRVVRHRPITGITVVDGSDPTKLFTLSPAFSPMTLEYDVTVPGGTPQVTITPAKASGYSFSVNGGLANMPGTITVPPGGTTSAFIVATYPGGSITYKVNVHREDLLTGITVSAGSLSPSFSAAVTEYEVLLDAETASTRITPVASDCPFAIDGNAVEYLDVTLEPGGEQVVTIVVTTSVPGEELTYTVTVRRAGP